MSEVTPPPGLVGELARSIYDISPRPVPEIALTAALGLMAGVAGRSYNVSGTGLNQFFLVLARTGRGKEAINVGISRIITTLSTPADGRMCVPSAATFIGPSDAASGQGLARALASRDRPCFVSIVGEFGHRFAQMADDRATDANRSLRRFMLDSYAKSGRGVQLGETVYSDRDKNIPTMIAPAFSLVGESTPDSFYEHVDERAILDGLLGRFSIIEYQGPRPPLNEDAAFRELDPQMLGRFGSLAAKSLSLNSTNEVVNVRLDEAATALSRDFDAMADGFINGPSSGVIEEVWNRAHLKLLKLAALIAVGMDIEQPTITLPVIEWARAQVDRDIRRLIARFDSGDIGTLAGNEAKQQEEVRRVINEFVTAPFEKYEKLGGSFEMHAAGVVSHQYVQRRLLSLPIFSRDPIKATPALKRSIQNLIDGGELEELNPHKMWDIFGVRSKAYRWTVENTKSHVAMLRQHGSGWRPPIFGQSL